MILQSRVRRRRTRGDFPVSRKLPLRYSRDPRNATSQLATGLAWVSVTVALDQPLLVVPSLELPEGLDEFGYPGEVPDPKQVLRQSLDKSFGDPIALGSRTKLGELVMPRKVSSCWKSSLMAHVGASTVVADVQPRGGPFVEVTELRARLGGVAPAPRTDSPTGRRGFRCTHWCNGRPPDSTLLVGHGRRRLGPQRSSRRSVRMDPSWTSGPRGLPDPLWSLQVVLAHQRQGALLRGPDTPIAAPVPDLAIALAAERRLGQHAADVADQSLRHTDRMHTTLSSYALEGIEAVPVDLVVNGDRARVVEPGRGRYLRSVKPRTTSLEARQPVQSVNSHTLSQGRSAPARSITGLSCPASPPNPEQQEREIENTSPW
jgi:hypothetical protein